MPVGRAAGHVRVHGRRCRTPTRRLRRPRATPPVRRLAKELGVDLAVDRRLGRRKGVSRADDVRASAQGRSCHARRSHVAAASTSRAVIAANLERQAAIPQVTTFRTVDCSALEALRGELGVSPLPVVVGRVVSHARSTPGAERRVARRPRRGSAREVHVGLAADTERGLVVPVVRDAGAQGIGALAAEITRLAEAARAGSLAPGRAHGRDDRRQQHRELWQRGGHADPVARHERHAGDRGHRAEGPGRRRRGRCAACVHPQLHLRPSGARRRGRRVAP